MAYWNGLLPGGNPLVGHLDHVGMTGDWRIHPDARILQELEMRDPGDEAAVGWIVKL